MCPGNTVRWAFPGFATEPDLAAHLSIFNFSWGDDVAEVKGLKVPCPWLASVQELRRIRQADAVNAAGRDSQMARFFHHLWDQCAGQ